MRQPHAPETLFWPDSGDYLSSLPRKRPRHGTIQRRAADHDGRIVTIGQLVLFSTETGDAWLLDPTDRLAARLVRRGSEPIHNEETDTTFAIGWKGRYRIDGPAFVYSDRDTGQLATSLGYPTDKLSQMPIGKFQIFLASPKPTKPEPNRRFRTHSTLGRAGYFWMICRFHIRPDLPAARVQT